MDINEESITWTGNAWTNLIKDDPKLLISCSLEGHVLIIKAATEEVIHCFRTQYDEPRKFDKFVSVQTCQLGFVLATESGYLHFYEYAN